MNLGYVESEMDLGLGLVFVFDPGLEVDSSWDWG